MIHNDWSEMISEKDNTLEMVAAATAEIVKFELYKEIEVNHIAQREGILDYRNWYNKFMKEDPKVAELEALKKKTFWNLFNGEPYSDACHALSYYIREQREKYTYSPWERLYYDGSKELFNYAKALAYKHPKLKPSQILKMVKDIIYTHKTK